jgi:ComF family protein
MGCNQLGDAFCPRCRSRIPFLPKEICSRCGTPRYSEESFSTHTCVGSDSISEIRSAAFFRGVIRKSIIALKYQNRKYYADALIQQCAYQWPIERWNADCIVPIPSSESSLSRRGYNQAELLADAYSHFTGIPWSKRYIQKKDHIHSQVGLSASDRKRNIKNAFLGSACSGLTLLLIDDVCTTGATMESAAVALKAAGAVQVFGVTVARTMDSQKTTIPNF